MRTALLICAGLGCAPHPSPELSSGGFGLRQASTARLPEGARGLAAFFVEGQARLAVTLPLSSSLLLLEPSELGLLQAPSVAVGAGPLATAALRGLLEPWVATADSAANQLSFVQARSRDVERVALPASPHHLATGDLDADGAEELVVTLGLMGADHQLAVVSARRGVFEVRQLLDVPNAQAVAVGDLDRDGDLDVAVAQTPGRTVRLFENQAGTLRAGPSVEVCENPYGLAMSPGPGATLAVTCGDEGLDVIEAPARGSSGEFTRRHLVGGSRLHGLVAVDLDGDGEAELAAADPFAHRIWLWTLGAGGVVEHQALDCARGPIALAPLDVDQDQDLDLALIAFEERKVELWETVTGRQR